MCIRDSPSALLALAPLPSVLADARPSALLALAPLPLVLADARPSAILAPAPFPLVLADARPLVLADARPSALLALAPLPLVLADARPSAILALAPLLDSTLRGGQLERRFCDPLRTVVADSNQSKTEYKRDKATNGPLDGHEGPRLYGNRNQQRRLCSALACASTRCFAHAPTNTSIRPPISWWPFILSWSISIDSIKLESGRFYPQICV